jgi:crotonobetainyl-CoA:carnitine CoA-transferase CaiB-like acyl-CoA transferase
MDKLGVGYEALRAINPKLIYCSITGYGQTGPYRDRAGHDMNYLSVAGVLSYNGRRGSGPAPISVQVADVAGGSCHAVMGILAAVIHRTKTGVGQHVDISMTDAAFSLHALTAPIALQGGAQPEMERTQLNGGSFYDCYETADGRYLSVGGLEPQFGMAFCQAIGKPQLAPQLLIMEPTQLEKTKKEIATAIKSRSLAEWQEVFSAIDACVEPVLTFAEACENPHIKARELLVDVPATEGNPQRQLASPFKFSETPPVYQYAGVSLGRHTSEVLHEIGLKDDAIASLREKKVVQ